jgi:hypothetical protein
MALLTGLSLYATHSLLAKFEGLLPIQRKAILIAFATAVTILPSLSFSEREHILLLGLFPLVLLQLLRSDGVNFHKGELAAITIPGALAVLIKPPFLLIPALLMLDRALRRRAPLALFGAETWYIAFTTFAYIAVSLWLFSDYIHIILPDFARLYLVNSNPESAFSQLFEYGLLFGVFFALEAWLNPMHGAGRRLMLAFYALALACLVPFALQNKGYYYHLIPAIGFFFCAFALSAESYIATYAPIRENRIAGIFFLVALIGLAYSIRPPLLSYPTAQDYRTLPLTVAIREACGPLDRPCRVFILNDSMETVPQTEYYGGFEHASRFPSLWFLPPIENNLGNLPVAKQEALRNKYTGMMAEDFKTYKPDVLALIKGLRFLNTPNSDFDFIRYFSQQPDFAHCVANYRKVRTFTFDRQDYFGGTTYDRSQAVTFDIYKLKGSG